MEGFCRGCLVKYDEPTDLIPYSEKNRRLFIYSTGLQVKRNDTFTFQLCKDCYLNMKQSCTFKKQCRNSEKKLKNYMLLKEDGDAIDFCSYIKNCEDLLTIRLPFTSGNSTPAHQKSKEDDNESTCTSIRNFMSDILQGEEVPDTEARIIRELIEEEADVLDDSLDSHWLQDDMSIETEFRMDFNFSPFSTPRSIQNDHCYTPKRLNDDRDDYFTLKQIDKPPDEQYHMPILDDCDIDIDQPASIPMDVVKTDCFTQEKSIKYEINNLNVNEAEFDSYSGVKIQNFIVDNVKNNETERQNYGLNDLKLNETESQNYEIHNLNVDETECDSYVEIQHFEVNNVKHEEMENQNYEMKDLKLCGTESQNYEIQHFEVNNVKHEETDNQNYEMKDIKLNETEIQNYEVDNTVKININANNEGTYFVEQMTEIEPNKIEDDFLNIGDKTQDFIAVTEIENDFYNITNNSNQSKVKIEIDESSILNNELEYYISKAELKKKSNLVSNKCLIDRNLEKALENEDNKEIPLDILISSPKVDIRSGASTPTIRNILFGDTILDSNDSPKLGQCIEKFQPIEEQTNILDDFFKGEDSNIGNLKVKEEIVPDLNINSPDLVKNKVEILEIKVIKERDDKENNLIKNEEEKSEDIRDLIEDYVTNVYENINVTENVEIDALELLKATNATLDDSIFKKPLSPLYNKYDLETSQCKICNKNFKTQINLKIHFAKKHKFKIVSNIPKDDFKLLVCNICGCKLKGKANLNRHKKKLHKGEFSCTECMLSFATELGLDIHKRKHKEDLIKNTPKVINTQKEYPRNSICNICGKKFTASHYKMHLLRHLKEFQFKCDICDKGFYRQGDYKNHLRTHTKTRPFECRICTKSYKLRASLNMHYNKVHLVKQKVICDICSTTFTSKRMLKNHFGTKLCNPANKTSDEQCNLASKTSEEQMTPNNNKTSVKRRKPAKQTSEEQCNPDNKTSEEQCNLASKSDEQLTPNNNKTSVKRRKPANQTSEEQCNSANESSEELCNPDKTSMEQCNPDNKTSDEQLTPNNNKTVKRRKPAKLTSEEQCNPDNESSEELCNPDKTSMEQCNPDNKTSEEQCDRASKTSDAQLTPNNNKTVKRRKPAKRTSEGQCNPDNESSEEHCNPDKTSMEQCNLDKKASEKQCNSDDKASEEQCYLANKTSEEHCNSVRKTQEVITEKTNKPEEIITEEIEFTVKFSPISFKEDEHSDSNLDLLYLN